MANSPMHHHYGKQFPSHPNALNYTHSLTDPVASIALYRKMQFRCYALEFDPHFFVFNGIIQTILVAFSMKTSWACTGMLSSESVFLK